MSDFEKICETQEMINNQHNIMSERIRALENSLKSMESTLSRMDKTFERISSFISVLNQRYIDDERTATKRYDVIIKQIQDLSTKGD